MGLNNSKKKLNNFSPKILIVFSRYFVQNGRFQRSSSVENLLDFLKISGKLNRKGKAAQKVH